MERYRIRSPIGGAPVYYLPETDSTMTVAREVVASGAPSGVVVLTDYQRSGRGRLTGRRWVSPPGQSLMFTAAVQNPAPRAAPLIAGLAVAVALETECGLRPELKWPNDVLVENRKICGILCEYAEPWLYVGVGLNIYQREFSAELKETATSVALEAEPPDRDLLLTAILTELGRNQSGWRDQVERRLWRRGGDVLITEHDGSRSRATVEGVSEDGSLVVVRSGVRSVLVAGELALSDTLVP